MKNKFVAMLATMALAVTGLFVAAIPASAHTPSASATCSALSTNLVSYQTKPGVAEIPGALITAEVSAWDETTNPGQSYIAPTPDIQATYDLTESRQGPELTPFIAGNPGQPFIAPTVVHHDAIPAVYGPITPAVPADLTPNHVVVTIDGVVQDDVAFGGSFVKTYNFTSAFVAHAWSVAVTAWDDPTGSNGWTTTLSGTTAPCYDNSLRPVTVNFDFAVVPPTCVADGSLPDLPDGAPVGYTLAWDREFNGPGTYTLTATEEEGRVIVGDDSKVFIVEAATGYQNEDSEAACYVAPPTKDDLVTVVDGTFACNDTTVKTTTTTISYTFTFDSKDGTYSDSIAGKSGTTVTETQTRNLTVEEMTKCPVVPGELEETEVLGGGETVVPPPVIVPAGAAVPAAASPRFAG